MTVRVHSFLFHAGGMDIAVSVPHEVALTWGLSNPEDWVAVRDAAIARAQMALREHTPCPGESWTIVFLAGSEPVIRRV